jgi:hypothetical protein
VSEGTLSSCIRVFRTTFTTVSATQTAQQKSKTIPVTDRWGPLGGETSRLSHSLNTRLTDGGEVVSLTHRSAVLYPPRRFLVLISVTGWVHPRIINNMKIYIYISLFATLSMYELWYPNDKFVTHHRTRTGQHHRGRTGRNLPAKQEKNHSHLKQKHDVTIHVLFCGKRLHLLPTGKLKRTYYTGIKADGNGVQWSGRGLIWGSISAFYRVSRDFHQSFRANVSALQPALFQVRYWLQSGRLCGLVVRVPGYRKEMYWVSCEVRTEFIYVL